MSTNRCRDAADGPLPPRAGGLRHRDVLIEYVMGRTLPDRRVAYSDKGRGDPLRLTECNTGGVNARRPESAGRRPRAPTMAAVACSRFPGALGWPNVYPLLMEITRLYHLRVYVIFFDPAWASVCLQLTCVAGIPSPFPPPFCFCIFSVFTSICSYFILGVPSLNCSFAVQLLFAIMGACLSTGGMADLSDEDKRRHQLVEKQLKEVSPPPPVHSSPEPLTRFQAKVKMATQVKVTQLCSALPS